jgi:hypothetical protein
VDLVAKTFRCFSLLVSNRSTELMETFRVLKCPFRLPCLVPSDKPVPPAISKNIFLQPSLTILPTFTTFQWRTQEFCSRGGLTNSTEDRGQRERRSGGGSPYSGVPLNLQMSETRILVRLLRMYFPRNWEFGSSLSKVQNFGGV